MTLRLSPAHHLHVAPTPTAEGLLALDLDGPVPPDLIRRREAHWGASRRRIRPGTAGA